MNKETQVALAVGAGYLLGRRRKMRLALMLGGAAMTGGLGGVPGQLLRRGTKMIGSTDMLGKLSPELSEVTGLIGGELLPVGKAAARAAVSGRINAFSDRVHERAEALRSQSGVNGEAGEQEEEAAGDGQAPARSRRRAPADEEPQDEAAEDEAAEDEVAEDEVAEEEEPAGRRPARAGRATSRDGERGGTADDRDEDDIDQPVRAAGRTARTAAGRAGAPVRRTRR